MIDFLVVFAFKFPMLFVKRWEYENRNSKWQNDANSPNEPIRLLNSLPPSEAELAEYKWEESQELLKSLQEYKSIIRTRDNDLPAYV